MIASPATALLPNLLNSLATGPRDILLYSFFKVGGVAVSLLFLLKVAVFVAILIGISHLLQKLILGNVFRYLHVSEALKFALSRFATYTFFAFGIFIGLQSLGVNLSSLVIFGGAVGVGVGLGLQNVVSNFVAGIILLIEQPIRLNDRVQTEGVLGDVVKIGARSTWVRTNENVIIIVPNNEFIQNAVTNWTVNDSRVRVATPFGVSYNADPEQVRGLALQVARANANVLPDPAPSVVLRALATAPSTSRSGSGPKLGRIPRLFSNPSSITHSLKSSKSIRSNSPFRSAISISARQTFRSPIRLPRKTPPLPSQINPDAQRRVSIETGAGLPWAPDRVAFDQRPLCVPSDRSNDPAQKGTSSHASLP